MKAMVDEFLHDECEVEAFMEQLEGDFVEYCDGCNEPVYAGDEALGVVVRQGDGTDLPVCICRKCYKEMSHKDLLDLLGIDWFDGDAERAIPYAWDLARNHNMRKNAELRRTITTAAKMMKEARA